MTTLLVLPSSGDSPPAETPAPSAMAQTAALTAGRATAFIRGQAAWLQRAVDRVDDDMVLELVLGAHDRSHDRWVTLIAQVERDLGDDAAAAVNIVYAHFGRVVGSLEARSLRLLDPAVAHLVRPLVRARIDDVTERAAEALWVAAAQV